MDTVNTRRSRLEMKTAKSYKLILLTILCIVTLMAFVTVNTGFKANAQTGSSSPMSYFSGTDMKFENDKVTAKANATETFRFSWNIVCDDTEIKFAVDDKINSVKMAFDLEAEDSTKEDIKKELNVTFGTPEMTVNYDGDETKITSSRELLVKTEVVEKVLNVYVNGTLVSKEEKSHVKNAGLTPMKNVTFSFGADEDGVFSLEYVDLKAKDGTGAYKQTFELEGTQVKTLAKPRAKLSDDMYMADGSLNFRDGKQYTVTVSSYSLTGISDKNYMYIATNSVGTKGANLWYANSTLPKSFVISLAKDVEVDETVELCIKSTANDYDVIEVLPVTVYAKYDANKPTYIDDAQALERYIEEVEKATKVEYDEGKGYVRLGDDYLIPSLKELITETVTPYSQMSVTVYYMTPSSDISTTSSMSIYLDSPGDYKFFVIFADEFGNKLTKEDFFTVGDDPNDITYTELGKKYIFTFHIEDDAPLSVKAPESQGEGFLNTEYHASDFDVTAYNYSTTYQLFYNENKDADASDANWKEIVKSSSVNDKYESDYFTADQVKAIGYDGELVFTPTEKGAYKIVCSVSSSHTSRTASATSVIKVENEFKTLESDSDWLEQNVWSVVFLAVGTVCLIGIIVLLFIKPKEKQTEVE